MAMLAAAWFTAGVSCSQNAPNTGAAHSIPPSAGPVTVVATLPAAEATNRARALETYRHGPKQAGFLPRTFSDTRSTSGPLRYLLYVPARTNEPLPLVLSLHGGGPRRQFEHLLEPYAPGFAYGLGRLTAAESQRAHPCFVVAPWSNNRGWDADNLRLVLALLEALEREFPIDTNRVYVTGQSMGGFGTWSILAAAPKRFAAAIPICGGGEPATAASIRHVPIWALHGSADTIVGVDYTRKMVAALHAAGGTPRYWEYASATHAETAERAYGEPELLDWLFAQQRR